MNALLVTMSTYGRCFYPIYKCTWVREMEIHMLKNIDFSTSPVGGTITKPSRYVQIMVAIGGDGTKLKVLQPKTIESDFELVL